MSVPCRSCRAPVIWLEHAKTGKPAPIDAEPVPDGNILVDPLNGAYRVLAERSQRELASAQGSNLYTNHFVTCPQASAWKRARDYDPTRPVF